MRLLFSLLTFLLFHTVCFSQDEKPSPQQIQEQLKQTINDAKKERADLKKKIAEAKAKNEVPEELKQMNDQLATLEQMITMLEKSNPVGTSTLKTPPSSKTAEPKYVFPFTPIVLKQPVSIPSEEQAKDHLFWYSGKKIDANTLITTTGLIVRRDEAEHRLILQPDKQKDSSYYNLVNTLGLTQKMKADFANRMNGIENSFFMYPVIKQAYDEYDLIKDGLYEMAGNTIVFAEKVYTGSIDVLVQRLADYINNLPPPQFIPPPKRSDLCACDDPNIQKEYQENLDTWREKFFSEEMKVMRMMGEIQKHLDYHETHNLPGSVTIQNMLNDTKFGIFILERLQEKVSDLCQRYEDGDALLEDGLIHADVQLLTWLRDFDDQKLPEFRAKNNAIKRLNDRIKNAITSDRFEKYIEKQKAARNFKVVFNYSIYLRHEYNKKILLDNYNIENNFLNTWMEGLKKFNRFTLSVKLNFEFQMGEENDILMTATGNLESEKTIVSMGIEECQLNLRITDANYTNKNTSEETFKIPMKFLEGTKTYFKQGALPYTGPAHIGMEFPRFKINFCGDESEVKMDLLTYKPADIKIHDHDNVKKVYTIDMLAYANKMFVSVLKAQTNVNELISNAGTMISMSGSQMLESTGNPALDKMSMDNKMNKKRYDMQYALAKVAHTEKTVIKLGKLNPAGSTTIIHTMVDIADENDPDKKALNLVHGYVTIELVHTPK